MYEEKMSSSNPGLIVILLDQSYSMEDPHGNSGLKKKDSAALAVNRVIKEIIEASAAGEKIKNRCFISVIGYGLENIGVEVILSDFISNINDNPIRREKIKKSVPDGAGGLVEIEEEFPIWVEPKAEYGTPMDLAFEKAYDICKNWCDKQKDSFPPIVINITDGEPNDMKSTKTVANKLMSLSNNDGNVLIFNVHIADGLKEAIVLPDNSNLFSGDYLAEFLFDISSVIPDKLFTEAERVGFKPKKGARAMVYNADAENLIRLLNFGSSAAR